ncbi:hypothetical protein RvY_13911-4 [Ramazzottius varieornatus]|uniref:Uncharacterized protein n=1 Tax=Ramazzottius varieornatus TaxID=947166 RepID=A0A1D1VPJ0_RAMVA|nr:hypothetical protein RvY_13911-4 [Ramazzottius varieornatus]
MSANSSADVFEVPDAIDTTSCSIKRSVEPLIDSLHQLLNLYTSRDQRLLLTLVQATKACLDKSEMPFPQELLPCLDYSFGQEQLLDLLQPRSVFGNRELCRKHLRHNISLCLPAQPHSCNEKHLLVLRNFARMYYKCASSVPPTVQKPGDSGGNDLAVMDEDEFADLQMAQEKSSAAFSPNSAHSSAFLTLFLLTKWCLFFVFTGPMRLL